MKIPSLNLRTGDAFPALGLGLWKVENQLAASIVREAVQVGYRHFDCACDYGNEPQVGAGLAAAMNDGMCRREDIWVTSKLWNTYHEPQHVRAACERSLSDLQLDELDLYLVHFPIALAFVPSSLMLGVTQHVSSDLGAFPLLWVVPLAIYLLTFIIVFSRLRRGTVAVANLSQNRSGRVRTSTVSVIQPMTH